MTNTQSFIINGEVSMFTMGEHFAKEATNTKKGIWWNAIAASEQFSHRDTKDFLAGVKSIVEVMP